VALASVRALMMATLDACNVNSSSSSSSSSKSSSSVT
jgi:hypothetical protein